MDFKLKAKLEIYLLIKMSFNIHDALIMLCGKWGLRYIVFQKLE